MPSRSLRGLDTPLVTSYCEPALVCVYYVVKQVRAVTLQPAKTGETMLVMGTLLLK